MRNFTYGVLLGTVLSPFIALAVIWFGAAPVHATADPSRWETFLARRAFAASIARQATKLENPVAPTGENLRAGLKIYRDDCSGCHGDWRKPSHWGTTAFYPRVPQFASEPPLRSDWQMFWIVKRGVRYSGMGAWEGEISEDKIWKVVTFLSHMKDLPPDVQVEWTRQTSR